VSRPGTYVTTSPQAEAPSGTPSLLRCGWAPSGRIASGSGKAGTDPGAPYRTRPPPPVKRDR